MYVCSQPHRSSMTEKPSAVLRVPPMGLGVDMNARRVTVVCEVNDFSVLIQVYLRRTILQER